MVNYNNLPPEAAKAIAWEEVMQAWFNIQEAHLIMESVNSHPMDEYAWAHVHAAENAANDYYKALQKWGRLAKQGEK